MARQWLLYRHRRWRHSNDWSCWRCLRLSATADRGAVSPAAAASRIQQHTSVIVTIQRSLTISGPEHSGPLFFDKRNLWSVKIIESESGLGYHYFSNLSDTGMVETGVHDRRGTRQWG